MLSEAKEVLLPGGQALPTLVGQEEPVFLPIQKLPPLAWRGPERGELLKETVSSKGEASLWRASRGAARAEEKRARIEAAATVFIVKAVGLLDVLKGLIFETEVWLIYGGEVWKGLLFGLEVGAWDVM